MLSNLRLHSELNKTKMLISHISNTPRKEREQLVLAAIKTVHRITELKCWPLKTLGPPPRQIYTSHKPWPSQASLNHGWARLPATTALMVEVI